ncbi:MAG TPA: DUF4398 domain-containing protein [Polyangia bacterium]|nr:DUF4398 domain-containing protein [Polyangia bacterium]
MKLAILKIALPAGLALFANACATTDAPATLVLARLSYSTSSSGPAATLAAPYLADARVSLEKANQEFATNGDTGVCRDYAYIAENKLELADTVARTAIERQSCSACTPSAAAQ